MTGGAPAIMGDPEDELGSVRPSPEVRAELVAFVRNDQGRLGEVYLRREQGLTADQIAADLGVATSGFVSNYARTLRALTDGDLPTAPSLALAAARTFRRLLKEGDWSPTAHKYLERNTTELERLASDERPEP